MRSRTKAALFACLVFVASNLALSAGDPVVSNVQASQRPGTQLVDIYYDLADPDSAALTVSVVVSINGGVTYDLPATSFTGDVGGGVAPGLNKKITWNAGQDWPNKFSSNVRFRVTSYDSTGPVIALSGDLSFGTVTVGGTATRTLTIQNTGKSALTVNSVSYPGGFSGNWGGGTVAAHGSLDVTVTFAPTAAQSYAGMIVVSSDATGGQNTQAVSGTGEVAPTRVIVLNGDLSFGAVTVGGTATRTLTIHNIGNSVLTVNSISYPAGFSGNWSGGTVAAHASLDVIVTFAPTAAQSYSGTITVNSDATSGQNTQAVSGTGQGPPAGMALIPAGAFTMGDSLGDGFSDELPLHTVYVSAFYLDKYEVTKALWDEVYQWAVSHGYSFAYGAAGKAANHPAQSLTWYDAVKWCNARSEREGRVPAYYTSAAQTTVYRSGELSVQNDWVKWNAGYRLPTEAEWEKAARGGLSGQRFPWGYTITQSQANYYSYWESGHPYYAYDVNPTEGYRPTYAVGGYPYTSPVGSFAANGYGLYDMAGNVWEWCWDWYGSYSSSTQSDPRGPFSGSDRVFRGGCWYYYAGGCRVTHRDSGWPDYGISFYGFRSALPPGQP